MLILDHQQEIHKSKTTVDRDCQKSYIGITKNKSL